MYGIEIPDLIRFFMQFGVAIAGAASLWGFIFFVKSGKDRSFVDLARIAFWIFSAGFLIFIVAWFLAYSVFFTPDIQAHEGITLAKGTERIENGLLVTFPVVLTLALVGLLFFSAGLISEKFFLKFGKFFFLAQFFLISLFTAFIVYSGELGLEQLTHFLHNWHSILTLGTVISVDILYLATMRKDDLRRVLYIFFPFMSAVIWIGLGLDFVSAAVVYYGDGFQVGPQFIFNQVVVAIIILNGILLTGRETNVLRSLVKPDRVDFVGPREELIFGLSGSVSIVSWSTITFIDFSELTAPIFLMFVGYVLFIVFVFITQKILKKIIMRPISLTLKA